MSLAMPLSEDDAAWVSSYAGEVCATFSRSFTDARERFQDGKKLLDRFAMAVDIVLGGDRAAFRGVDEAHNELCVAAALLDLRDPMFSKVDYEPPLPGCTKSIDFRAQAGDGLAVFVDVKTIKPAPKDRWEQFERAVREGWFPENVTVSLSREWLGGELWHAMFAARSRMLEYSLELEQKIRDSKLEADNTRFILALCGEGFYWHEDELEDFVAFYYSGSHRSDDPFARVEQHYVEENKLVIDRKISRFACLRRRQGDVLHSRLNWNVQPPIGSGFE